MMHKCIQVGGGDEMRLRDMMNRAYNFFTTPKKSHKI
jgi:hypothetical protein